MRALIVSLIILSLLIPAASGRMAEVNELQDKIASNKARLDDLQKQIEDYKNLIATKQAEVNSLRRQLLVLDDKIAKYQLDIAANELQLATVGLEITSISEEIDAKDKNINNAKDKVAEIIRQLYISDQRSLVEILVLHKSLSVFFDQLNYLSELQGTLQSNINQLQTLKAELEVKQQDLSNKKIEKVLPVKEKAKVLLIMGKHLGSLGEIAKIEDKKIFVKSKAMIFETKNGEIIILE